MPLASRTARSRTPTSVWQGHFLSAMPAAGRRSGRSVAAWLMLLILGHVLALGASRWPCEPATGGPLDQAPSEVARKSRLRVATFNIHSGRNASGQPALDATAATLQGCDLVGLNEVGLSGIWSQQSQAELLGSSLNVPSLFAPCERRWGRDSFGNGLLCGLPVRRWRSTPLPCSQERGYRSMLLVETEFCGGPLHVLITHVDRRRDRQRQLQLVLREFLALPSPAILLGDLNSTADDPELQAILRREDVADPWSQSESANAGRIDWILTRGLKTVAAGSVDQGASDHPAYWAELELVPDNDE